MAALRPAGTVTQLQVSQPIAGDVDSRRDGTDRQASQDEDDPYLTGVEEVLDVSNEAAGARG
jgi:hypothetical protein